MCVCVSFPGEFVNRSSPLWGLKSALLLAGRGPKGPGVTSARLEFPSPCHPLQLSLSFGCHLHMIH